MRAAAAGLLAAAAACAQAGPAAWRIDPAATRLHFEVLHFGTSTSRGRFDRLVGSIVLDPVARSGEISIEVDTASVNTGLAPFDGVLRGSELLASSAHPKAWFVARQVEFVGATPSRIRGEITLRGISRPLELRALRFGCRTPDASPPREVCGGDFEAELRRSDFGMHFGLPFVADRVRLQVQVEAVRD